MFLGGKYGSTVCRTESSRGRTKNPGEKLMRGWEFNGVAMECKSRSSYKR